MPQMVYVNPRHSLHGKQSTLLQNRPLLQAICPGSLWVRDNRWLLSRVRWLAGPAGGQGPFVPVGATNRDKNPPFCPGWCLQPGQNSLAPLSPSLSPPEPFSSLVLAVLGSGEGSSCSFLHHICEDLWFPVHPSALKVWGLFFSSSLACIAHFMI